MNTHRLTLQTANPASKLLSLAVVFAELATVSAGAGPLRDRLRRRAAKRARIGATRAPLPPGVEKRQDVPYGEDRRQRMDVYLPTHPKRAPVILMVHGGGWRYGDKANRGVADSKIARWVPRGYVFVSVNYRMLPDADLLAQAEDGAVALRVAQEHAQAWGADPERFILMGHSAGAHLVSLLSAQPSRALARGAKPWLGAIVIDSAALDVEAVMSAPHLPLYDDAFGTNPDYWRSACPSHALSSAARPMRVRRPKASRVERRRWACVSKCSRKHSRTVTQIKILGFRASTLRR
jgi:arylformamidase